MPLVNERLSPFGVVANAATIGGSPVAEVATLPTAEDRRPSQSRAEISRMPLINERPSPFGVVANAATIGGSPVAEVATLPIADDRRPSQSRTEISRMPLVNERPSPIGVVANAATVPPERAVLSPRRHPGKSHANGAPSRSVYLPDFS